MKFKVLAAVRMKSFGVRRHVAWCESGAWVRVTIYIHREKRGHFPLIDHKQGGRKSSSNFIK